MYSSARSLLILVLSLSLSVPLLVPAMNSHLLESKSTDPLMRQSSLNKLDLIMIVLKKVQDIYSSATFIRGLFLQAIEKINSPQYTGTNTPVEMPPPQQQQRQISFSDPNAFRSLTPANLSAGRGGSGVSGPDFSMDSFWQMDDRAFELWDTMPPFSDSSGLVETDLQAQPQPPGLLKVSGVGNQC